MNYNATFDFSKKESAYIAGSVYMVSMLFGPVMGLIVVSHSKHITVQLLQLRHLEKGKGGKFLKNLWCSVGGSITRFGFIN